MCERDRETEGDEDSLPYWPITSSLDHTTLSYLQSLTSLPLLLLDQGSLRAIAPAGAWRPVSATDHIYTQDSRLKTDPCETPISAAGRVCIISQRSSIPVFSHVTYFCLFTHVRPANHIVYTAGTSSSVKGQYTTWMPLRRSWRWRTTLWEAKLTWYLLSWTRRICLYSLELNFGFHGLRSI